MFVAVVNEYKLKSFYYVCDLNQNIFSTRCKNHRYMSPLQFLSFTMMLNYYLTKSPAIFIENYLCFFSVVSC